MEIDLSNVRKDGVLYGVLGVLVLFLLALLGRAYTPADGRLLTWQEWQVRKLQQAYRAERLLLLEDVHRLAELLAVQPDPARAQVTVQNVRRRLAEGSVEGVEALADERALADAAAQAVLDWASGIGDYNAAVDAVAAVQRALDDD